MGNTTHAFRLIAELYLETYRTQKDVPLLLTDEQVKDASVAIMEMLASCEEEARILQQRRARYEAHGRPDMVELAALFVDRFRAQNNLEPVPLTKAQFQEMRKQFDALASSFVDFTS